MLRWLLNVRMRRDVRRIIEGLAVEDRARFRATPESELILLHRGFGTGLRDAFRSNRFPGLSAYCHEAIRRRGEPWSFDALSSIAIREIWATLQKTT
jgi:hypothetical protein